MAKEVLIIDDDEAMVNLLSTLLQTEGFGTKKSQSAADGLELLSQNHPDLILLDIMMPEMDGFKFLAMLRSNPETRGIPVIILSVLGDQENMLEGFRKEADDYITKPFDPQLLVTTINNVLDRSMEERLGERARRIEALLAMIRKLEEDS